MDVHTSKLCVFAIDWRYVWSHASDIEGCRECGSPIGVYHCFRIDVRSVCICISDRYHLRRASPHNFLTGFLFDACGTR